MIRNRVYLETCAGTGGCPGEGDTSTFRADLHELPLANNAVDAVVLHHVLEGAEDARTAIREIARVLAPGGRLVIVSFNPWSLWGVRSAYARFFRDHFSGLKFVSPGRLLDWLTVLGFELQQEVRYLAYELPFASRHKEAGLWKRLRARCAKHRLPLGGVYVVTAVKQVAAMRPDWTLASVPGRKLAPAAYPKLSARVAYLPVRDRRPARIEDPG